MGKVRKNRKILYRDFMKKEEAGYQDDFSA